VTKKRFAIFLVLSGGLHMLAVAFLFFMANSGEERIYDSYQTIEVASYITPIVKPQEPKLEKPKHEKINEVADGAKEVTNQEKVPVGGTTHEAIAEELASEGSITAPARLLTAVRANRTEAARRADYSGTSIVELVVGSNGAVKNAKLANHLDHGLDDVALKIARDLKFKPAMINDKAVASRINLKIKFTSKD
jgi:TonB family protein